MGLCESLLVFYLFISKFDILIIQNNLNNFFKFVDDHITQIRALITKDDIDALKTNIITNNTYHENQNIWNDTLNRIIILVLALILITHLFILFISIFLKINPLKFMLFNIFLSIINSCVEIAFVYMITKYQFL
tara:strand:+ start:8511 stop:8912 length:402 start_codon:yes stop_codon:yes gene_type:complete